MSTHGLVSVHQTKGVELVQSRPHHLIESRYSHLDIAEKLLIWLLGIQQQSLFLWQHILKKMGLYAFHLVCMCKLFSHCFIFHL
jgi:hypothetical protein